MTAALRQPTRGNWQREHRQDLEELVTELRQAGDPQLAQLAAQALADTKK